MPRPLNPLDPAEGPVASFAVDLRTFRDGVPGGALSLQELARRRNIGRSTLHAVLGGRRLPSRKVLAIIIEAWGGDVAEWIARLSRAENDRFRTDKDSTEVAQRSMDLSDVLWEYVARSSYRPILDTLFRVRPRGLPVQSLKNGTQLPTEVVRNSVESLTSKGRLICSGNGNDALYSLNGNDWVTIGVSIQPDRVIAVAVDFDGNTVGSMHVQQLRYNTPDAALHAVVDIVLRLRGEHRTRTIAGIGVNISGIVSAPDGTVRFAPDLKLEDARQWRDANLGRSLTSALESQTNSSIKLLFDSDVNALAAFEYLKQSPSDSVVVVLIMDQSLRSGFVLGGTPLRGANMAAGEGGHLVIDADGPECRAGLPHRGCLETVASPRAVLERLGIDAGSTRAVKDGLIQADIRSRSGDGRALEEFHKSGRHIGSLLATTIALFDPKHVIVYARNELIDSGEFLIADRFQNGVLESLDGVHNSPFVPSLQVHWRSLSDESLAVASAQAAYLEYSHDPRFDLSDSSQVH